MIEHAPSWARNLFGKVQPDAALTLEELEAIAERVLPDDPAAVVVPMSVHVGHAADFLAAVQREDAERMAEILLDIGAGPSGGFPVLYEMLRVLAAKFFPAARS
ncbi:hypothetical protein [Streptomyces sp. H39-C1]|uniref:hypothetical protein n=1 Tax=Streptomyces sp. H39-C1 TaxID=3004355 RepID=UPI0022AF658C|nr:hypothetical protein [Streptomyces sp. H39-C1]MCZ4098072.1 hypothetical protein [Streptomyces sp. H39-C1]